MKNIITTTLTGVIALTLPVVAGTLGDNAKADTQVSESLDPNVLLIKQVSEQITAKPEQAGEWVKEAIMESKASNELVLQIVKAAVLAAPEQAEAIREVAVALAPAAEKDVEILVAAVLQGGQVAMELSDDAKAIRNKAKDGGSEPEGSNPNQNTVFFSNLEAFDNGFIGFNSLDSFMADTMFSPNVNHNAQGVIPGGGLIVIAPPTEVPPTTPVL